MSITLIYSSTMIQYVRVAEDTIVKCPKRSLEAQDVVAYFMHLITAKGAVDGTLHRYSRFTVGKLMIAVETSLD
jgi:hypothetical protein